MKKYNYLNFIKVICMLCVIMAHCMFFYADNPFWIILADHSTSYAIFITRFFDYSLMAFFVLTSGMLFNLSIHKKNKGTFELILNKAKRLLLPWFIFGIFVLVPLYTLFDIASFGRNQGLSLIASYKNMLLGIFADHTWFLLMLFWVSLIWIILKELMKKERIILGFFAAIALMLLDYYLLSSFDYYKISQLHQYILIFYLGGMTYHYIEKIENTDIKVLSVIEIILIIISLSGSQLVNGSFYAGVLLRIISAYMLLLLGIILEKAKLLDKIEGKRVYRWLVVHNMDMYLLQFPWIYLYYKFLYPRIGQNAFLCIICNYIMSLITIIVLCFVLDFGRKIIGLLKGKKLFYEG